MCLMPVIVAQNAMAAGQTNSLFIKLNPGSQKVNIQMNSYTLQINNLTGVSNTSENRIRSWVIQRIHSIMKIYEIRLSNFVFGEGDGIC